MKWKLGYKMINKIIILIYTVDMSVIQVTIWYMYFVSLVVKNVMAVQEKEPKTASSAQVIILTLMAHV